MAKAKKLYYSISEVAELAKLEPHVLRFWEKEFPQLKPKKSRGGNRTYQPKDIQTIYRIKQLLYDKGFTIEGARSQLKDASKEEKAELTAKGLIEQLKKELNELLGLFS